MSESARWRQRRIATWVVLAGGVWAGGCLDNPLVVEPPVAAETPPPWPGVVSDPVASGLSVGGAQALASEVVYVSLPPGSLPGAESAVIQNRATVVEVTGTVAAGGLDPVAIAAGVGDTLDMIVTWLGGDSIQAFVFVVRPSRPPIVVRTEPPPRKRDVPLNAVLYLVFSEPIDPTTLTGATVQVLSGTTPIAGRVAVVDTDQLWATFIPDAPLAGGVDYTLVATQGIHDLEGEPLEAPVAVPFTTAQSGTVAGMMGRIAFVRGDVNGPAGGIYVMNPDGSGAAALTGYANSWPTWSRDGSRIVFASDRDNDGWELYAMDADGSRVVKITTGLVNPGHPAWSPDGSEIAFTDNHTTQDYAFTVPWVYTMNSDASGITRLFMEDPRHDSLLVMYWVPAWSPDGSQIAVTRYSGTWSSGSGNQIVDDTSHVYVVKADGSGGAKLSLGQFPSWSPDGSSIAFARWSPGSCLGGEIYLMNADGSRVSKLTTGADVRPWSPLAWSPDGSKIAFSSMQAGPRDCSSGSDIYVINADGSGMTRLTYTGLDHSPAWSSRGEIR